MYTIVASYLSYPGPKKEEGNVKIKTDVVLVNKQGKGSYYHYISYKCYNAILGMLQARCTWMIVTGIRI